MQRSDYPNHVISSTGAAQEWWSFTFLVRRPRKVFVFAQWCMPRTAQCTLPHKSLFLSFLGLRCLNCLFLMADLMLLGSVSMSYARDYKLWTLEIAGQQWKIKTLCSQKANCTNKAWTQTPDTRGVFPTEAENIHHWASGLGLTF